MLNWIGKILAFIEEALQGDYKAPYNTPMPINTPSQPAEAPPAIVTPPVVPSVVNPDALLPDWSIIPAAHHNVRAICDIEGLTYKQKQVLTACVYIESGFIITAVHQNRDGKGQVLSTDYSLVQVNDYWHIGIGKDFPSVAYVMSHPEEQVRWMCQYYKQHGNLNNWCSFTSGAYLRVLGKV